MAESSIQINPEDIESDVYDRMAAQVLLAIRNYEDACHMRMQARSMEVFGNRGAFIAAEAATEHGRMLAIRTALNRAGV